jgi:hypothetical protein
MKTFKFIGWLALVIALITGCQKEKSYENGQNARPSDGSLQGAGGSCLGSVVAGTYKKDTALNATHFVTVTVTVNTLGSYLIYTDTLNGIYFRASGTFTAIGVNTVSLAGFGTPLVAGTNTFTVNYDSTACTFSITTTAAGGGGGGASVFTLDGSPTSCLSATSQGTYTAGTATNASNKETIHVNVTTIGTYSISTTAVNGVSFAGTGSFTTTGPQTVVLQASGTPAAAGNFQVPITAGATNCNFSLTVASGSTAAVYTLTGQPGACMSYTVQGTYMAGVAVTGTNTVTVQVNVTTIGSYSMSTTSVNGVTFAASGNFTTTGPQNVILTSSGTPTNAGTISYPLTAGTSSCTFQVVVLPNDYYPRTTNSNWSYMFDSTPTDTLLRYVIAPTLTTATGTYNIFMETVDAASPPPDSSGYFRKNGNSYYEYIDGGSFFGLDNPVWTDNIFLKDNQPVGTTWNTVFNGTAGGVPVSARFRETVQAVGATITAGGTPYANTITIREDYEYFNGTAWVDASGSGVYSEYSFSRNVGLVLWKIYDQTGLLGTQELTRANVY